jgi:hypothetical protein
LFHRVLDIDHQVVSRCVKVVYDGFTAIAAGLVESARRSVSWGAGCFYQQQVSSAGLYLDLHPRQQGMPNAAPLSVWIYGDPVEVVSALCQWVRAEAGVAEYSAVFVAVDQKCVTAAFPFVLIRIPEFPDTILLCEGKNVDRVRYLYDGWPISV